MKKVYVGMDIGSKVTCMAAIDPRGKMIDATQFDTSIKSMVEFIGRQNAETMVLLEEGELSGWAYRELTPYAKRVVVCDPRRNAWVAKGGSKNDKIDAYKLSELARMGSYDPVYHSEDEEMIAFKIAVQHYEESRKRVIRIKNQVKARLRVQGVIIKDKSAYRKDDRGKVLESVGNPSTREIIAQDMELLDALTLEKARSLLRVLRLSKNFPVIERLSEIPGVGPRISSTFVAYVQDPNRFSSRSKFLRYCRLGILKRSSNGIPIGREHIDKAGCASLKDISRKAFNAAMLTKNDNQFKRFYRASLERTGSEKNARLNTQRKIMLTMLAIWRDGTRYLPDED